jgi:uncharacterized membrane protein
MSSWKRDAASGLVVIVPLLVIAVVVNWLYARLSGLPVVSTLWVEEKPPSWIPVDALPIVRVTIALVVFILLVFAVGYLMRTTAGRLLESYLDEFFNRVPILRVLYNASKLAVETALTGTDELQTPVRIETWPGMRMTAFKTGKVTDDGREVLFLPTAPNITSGFVVEVASEDVIETDEGVERALTRILSAGFAEENRGIDIAVERESSEEAAGGGTGTGKKTGTGSDHGDTGA